MIARIQTHLVDPLVWHSTIDRGATCELTHIPTKNGTQGLGQSTESENWRNENDLEMIEASGIHQHDMEHSGDLHSDLVKPDGACYPKEDKK